MKRQLFVASLLLVSMLSGCSFSDSTPVYDIEIIGNNQRITVAVIDKVLFALVGCFNREQTIFCSVGNGSGAGRIHTLGGIFIGGCFDVIHRRAIRKTTSGEHADE